MKKNHKLNSPLKIKTLFLGSIVISVIILSIIISFYSVNLEEKNAIEEARNKLFNLSSSYVKRFDTIFYHALQFGINANKITLSELEKMSNTTLTSKNYFKDSDGAIRSTDKFSAAFLSNKNLLTSELKGLFSTTENLWKTLAPNMAVRFINFYIITKDNFIRIYPPKWALEIEADHVFEEDIFYSLATPENNPGRLPVWTPIYYDSIWKKWMTSLIIPLYDGEKFLGITGSDLILDNLFAELKNIQINEKWCTAFLFDNNGNIIAHPDYIEQILQKHVNMNDVLKYSEIDEPILRKFISKIINDEFEINTVFDLQKNQNTKYLIAVPLKNMQWNLAFYAIKKNLVQPFKYIKIRTLTLFFVFGLLLMFVMNYILNKLIFKRINKLDDGVKALIKNNFDYPLTVYKQDELGILEKGFVFMQKSIKEKIESLNREISNREKTEQKFRNLFNSGNDAILIHDLSGKIIDVNETTLRMYKVKKKNISKYSIVDDLSSSENPLEELPKLWEKVFDGKPQEFEWKAKRPNDGSKFDVQVNLKKVIFGNSELILATVRDITERKKMQKQLKENEDRLSKVMLAANDGMYDWNIKTNEVYYDSRYYTMAGYEPNEFPHKFNEFEKRIHPEDLESVLKLAKEHLSGKIERFRIEFRFKRKDGKWMWILGRGKIVERDDKGNPIRMVGTHRDIETRKKTEKELSEYQEHLEEIVEERTKELKEKNSELERMNEVFVNREFRIKELRDKIKKIDAEQDEDRK